MEQVVVGPIDISNETITACACIFIVIAVILASPEASFLSLLFPMTRREEPSSSSADHPRATPLFQSRYSAFEVVDRLPGDLNASN